MDTLQIADAAARKYGVDDALPDDMGVLRDYVATGLISREKVERGGSEIAFEATFEAPNNHPGTARSKTVPISEAAYQELGTLGVP